MKNIFLLPTTPNDETTGAIWIPKTRDWCNIYIISSDEEIKEWYIYEGKLLKASVNHSKYQILYGKPIILTTDPKLIADGVQAIDDEFLEWFVKNPSCERVDIEFNNRGITGSEKILKTFGEYKIIISKEETKQEYSIEEAAEKYIETSHYMDKNRMTDIMFGAKLQQERMYSEEEVLMLLNKREDYINSVDDFFEYQSNEDWFEQNKKKAL